ncbi:MAG: DUF5320 family protein [Spirochaetales bacterium]|nr:DUF5320 family protein [Spirochaetales bacterium]
MPRGDGTGPAGMGPMTGRAAGFCAGYGVPGFMNPYGRVGARPMPGYPAAWGAGAYPVGAYPGGYPAYGRFRPMGRGFGFGLGFGWRGGRGWGRGWW